MKQLSIEDFERDFAGKCLLVDVRDKQEYEVSHIRNAVNIQDASEIVARYRESGTNSVVLYCSVGYRSSKRASRLQPIIADSIYSLEGSIFAWANAGRSVYRGGEQVSVVHPYDAEWGILLDQRFWPAGAPNPR